MRDTPLPPQLRLPQVSFDAPLERQIVELHVWAVGQGLGGVAAKLPRAAHRCKLTKLAVGNPGRAPAETSANGICQYQKITGRKRSMMTAIERQTMKKVYLRLLPFCFILYFICYLDRVNIGFAALTMNKDLGLSSYIFGLGAGAFFWGYFILEVPSNLILDRVGARRWIARIMVTWGLVSGGFAFISGPVSFFTLRFYSALPKRASSLA